VGACEGTLRLDSPELGAFEWSLRLAGTAVGPERGLAFSVALGGRETRVFRFTHFLPEKAEYRCSLKSAAGGGGGGGGGDGGSTRGRSAGGGGEGGGGGGGAAAASGFDVPATVVALGAAGPGARALCRR
jgi:hypothetical protein